MGEEEWDKPGILPVAVGSRVPRDRHFPVGRGVPPSRQVGSRVPRDRVCRRHSAPCAQTIPKLSCLTPNRPRRGIFRRTCPRLNETHTKCLSPLLRAMIKLVLLCHQFRHRHEPKAVGGFRCADDQVINQFQSYEIRTGLELGRRIVVSLAGRRIA